MARRVAALLLAGAVLPASGQTSWVKPKIPVIVDVSYTHPPSPVPFGTGNFNTVPLNTVVTDTANGFNPTTFIYTVSVAGTYSCLSKLRWIDGSTSGVSYGQGVGITAADSPSFQWFVTACTRQGSLNQRLINLNAGDQLRMFAYDDTTGLTLSTAEMACYLIQ